MKTKKISKLEIVIFIFVFLIACLVRFYNFPKRVTFGPEQAMNLMTAGDYLTKPSLLGQAKYFRETESGLVLFSGAIFNYSLLPLELVFNFQPLPITAYFALLNLFTGLMIFVLFKKILSYRVALFSSILFLFNTYMIYHSFFVWNYNYFPLVFVFTIYFLLALAKKYNPKTVFILGLLSGLGINLQYIYSVSVLFVFLITLVFSVNKKRSIVFFVLGTLIGNLPMVIFDLRHNFYHLTTAWQYFKEMLSGTKGSIFGYYQLLNYWSLFALVGGYILSKIYSKNKLVVLFLIFAYVAVNIKSERVSFTSSPGMPKDLYLSDIMHASEVISRDLNSNSKYNVISLLDFDTRGHILRYPLEFVYHKKPESFYNYSNVPAVYAISETNYDFHKSNVWEILEIGNFDLSKIENVSSNYAVYKLVKK